MDRFSALLKAWTAGLATNPAVAWQGMTLGDPDFHEIHQMLLDAGDHGGLGQLQESLGHTNLILTALRPHLNLAVQLDHVGNLIKAAHWYRLARDPDRSRNAGERAILELGQVVGPSGLASARPHSVHYHAYALEMLADAAVCAQPEGARQFFDAAARAFRRLSGQVQDAEAAEIFPGQYTSYMLTHFVPWHPGLRNRGSDRISYKAENWLNI